MKLLLAIGAGSFIGGVLRYLLSNLIHTKSLTHFPVGTLTVNIIGCFIIGVIFGFTEKANLNQEWRLFLATGIVGGFTTFSAFSIETIAMLRDGQFWGGAAYVMASVVLGLFATLIGVLLIKIF